MKASRGTRKKEGEKKGGEEKKVGIKSYFYIIYSRIDKLRVVFIIL